MSHQKYLVAANRAVEFFISNMSVDGRILGEDVEQDPAFYYKLPALLYLAGKDQWADTVLSFIEVSVSSRYINSLPSTLYTVIPSSHNSSNVLMFL